MGDLPAILDEGFTVPLAFRSELSFEDRVVLSSVWVWYPYVYRRRNQLIEFLLS